MPVPTNLSDLSPTASNNSPAATDTISTTDDYLRAHAAILAKISDGTNALVSPTITTATITTANVTTLDTTNVEVTNIKAKDGTASATIADSTGVMTIASSVLTTADINGGTLDNVTIGGATPAAATVTTLTATSGTVGGAAITTASNTQTLTNKTLTSPVLSNPSFSGATANMGTVTTIDINGGTLDGVTIGGAAAGAGTFTTLTSTGNATLGDDPATDTHTINGGLTVKNTGSGNSLLIEDSASTDSTPFVILANGRIVQGHTSEVTIGAISNQNVQFHGNNVLGLMNTSNVTWYADAALSGIHSYARSKSNTIGTHALVASGDEIHTIAFYGSDGVVFRQAATIKAEVDGTASAADMPGRLVFSTTADGGVNPTERMRIDSAGQFGFPSVSPGVSAYFSKNITGATTGVGLYSLGQIQSDVTVGAYYYRTFASTANAVFTVPELVHYDCIQSTFGASSTVSNQIGFYARATLVGAGNNYGFYSNIPSGTGRWNFYAAGTADNYLGGKLTIGGGTAAGADTAYRNNGDITGATTAYCERIISTIKSGVTSTAIGHSTALSTEAASFTCSNIFHYSASQGTIGATSAVTTQYGFSSSAANIGATVNLAFHAANTAAVTAGKTAYGFYSAINAPTGGGTTWGFYAAGTASNYFAGDMQFDKTITAGGTTGNQTINKNAGSVNFAAAATSLTVTNSRVTANSIIVATVATNDTTMKSVAVVAGAGSFVLHANAAATAETRVNFWIVN